MADTPNDDALVDKVARKLAKNGYAFTNIELPDPYTADADYWNSQSRAAIAVLRPAIRAEALREAVSICEAGHAIDFKKEHADFAEGYITSCDDTAAAIIALIDKEKASD